MDSAKLVAGGAISYIIGPGFIPQLLLTIVLFIALQVVLTIIETVVTTIQNVTKQVVPLLPHTITGSYTIAQDPRLSKQISNSNNELNGLEYTYSLFVFIAPETFESITVAEDGCRTESHETGNKLKHVFHKGSKAIFPLMSPGVFMEADKNTMRVYMNSSLSWNNYVSVPNIPINKWFHLVIMMKGKFMDVFVNGNVAARQQFATVPKLNVGNVYIMSNQKFPKTSNENVTSEFTVSGEMKGMVSRLTYYSYALNYSQIDDIYRTGPSKNMVKVAQASFSGELPPYLHDDWWVTRY
jgi:hypothetical protein